MFFWTVNCQWTEWECSKCSATCRGGSQNCNRTIKNEAEEGGEICMGNSTGLKIQTCPEYECPGI